MSEEELKELLEALGQDTTYINPLEYKKFIIDHVETLIQKVNEMWNLVLRHENILNNLEHKD